MMTSAEKRIAVLRKKRQIRRRKKLRRIKLALLGISGLLILSLFLFLGRAHRNSSDSPALSQTLKPDNLTESAFLDTLKTMKKQDQRIQTILDNPSEYPAVLQKILANNIETLDFVLNYPKKKNGSPSASIGTMAQGEIPLLLQWDERWGYAEYGGSIIAASGCGPTCIAMVASGLTGREDITPAAVADYSMNHDFLTEEYDTKWDLMTYGCQEYGIAGTELGLDETVMANTLNNGSPIICSMGPGDFTANGHFIVLTGYQDGKFLVHDPNSNIRSERLWSFDELQGQILNLWYYQLCDWYL